MDQADLDALVQFGQLMLMDKHYIIGHHFLWCYDYILTFGDEVAYAWRGMRSWIFFLFLATRYTPILFLFWSLHVNFHRSESLCVRVSLHFMPFRGVNNTLKRVSCNVTKWIAQWNAVVVAILAQIAVTVRIYAITDRNKLPAVVLSAMILAQVGLGINIVYANVKDEALQVPQINLDPFIICFPEDLRAEGDAFSFLGVGFDLVAFAIIFARVRRTPARFPGIPSLLDTIFQGATIYFVVIFVCQLFLIFCMFLGPPWLVPVPGVAVTNLTPIMASRLMLSLKKASVDPTGPWSLQTVSSFSPPREDVTTRFPSRTIDMSFRVPETLTPSAGEEDTELESLPKPRNRW